MKARLWLMFGAMAAGVLACNPGPRNGAAGPPGRQASQEPGAPSGAPEPATIVRFEDVTAQAGIRFVHQNSKTARKYLIETMGSGVAVFDYNGDHKPDLFFVNGAKLPGGSVKEPSAPSLYRNEGNWKFTDVSREAGLSRESFYGMGATAGDYDGDGDEDLYVTAVLGPAKLYRNDGGRFTDVAKASGVENRQRWGTSCAWIDYDLDSDLDLFVCNYVKYRGLQDDQPCFSGKTPVYCIPSAYETEACTLYRNEGGGRFKDVSQESGIASAKGKALGVTVWDYDSDGLLDLFVACDTVPGFLFHNLGNGRFEDVGAPAGVAYNEEGVPHSGMGIYADDIFGDGMAALVITNYQGQQTSFYRQTSKDFFQDIRHQNGTATATGAVLGFGILFFDVDNDGDRDLLQVNGHVQDNVEEREPGVTFAQPTLLFLHKPEGQFQEVGLSGGEPFSQKIVGRGCAWADFDDDGLLDVVITQNNGPALLWRNRSEKTGNWLRVRLEGVGANTRGLGAEVRVTAAGVARRALIRTGSSYLSQQDLRAHFGLGFAHRATVEVRWPGGKVQTVGEVEANGEVVVREEANRS